MIFFILVSVLIASATAQNRPSFAGLSGKGVPDVAARFKPGGALYNPPQDVVNRFGPADTPTERIPVDANVDLKNRINTWPEENKPFWYVNAEAIQKHIGASPNRETNLNGNQPLFDSGNQVFESRFGSGSSQSGPEVAGNSFSIVMNNQWKTYVYDPITDAWYARRN
ncbi:uncharacterized protein LOC114335620 [Diabrotica virgifera virgifera]|uniref:Uncharacterized protein LOC114335620 n=1 Tax=Diabrotica virgifera virgifera TaxID=50390 RepID=A0A6P7GA24_DIAVI|nr:uncharacterized protein LOC114335620 [Diabrotica virgifera virgifera]